MNLTVGKVNTAVAKLGLMAFFPGDPEVRAGLVPILLDMIETEEQLDWLVNRALRLYAKWPGVAELRALYCSRFKPKDGMEAYSEIYGENFPSDRPAEPVAPLPPKRASTTTADAEFDKEIQRAAKVKKFPGCAAAPDRKKK